MVYIRIIPSNSKFYVVKVMKGGVLCAWKLTKCIMATTGLQQNWTQVQKRVVTSLPSGSRRRQTSTLNITYAISILRKSITTTSTTSVASSPQMKHTARKSSQEKYGGPDAMHFLYAI